MLSARDLCCSCQSMILEKMVMGHMGRLGGRLRLGSTHGSGSRLEGGGRDADCCCCCSCHDCRKLEVDLPPNVISSEAEDDWDTVVHREVEGWVVEVWSWKAWEWSDGWDVEEWDAEGVGGDLSDEGGGREGRFSSRYLSISQSCQWMASVMADTGPVPRSEDDGGRKNKH